MDEGMLIFNEAELAKVLRSAVLNDAQTMVEAPSKQSDLSGFEYISVQEQPEVSPLMTMSEDEILNFVEEFEISELATLSVAELNHIGEVLGVEPNILLGELD